MKKVLLSVFMSVGIVVGAFGVAYALGTFSAVQQGFRQGGDAEAAHITMTVEAGTADANSDFIPDDIYCGGGCPGGALSFAITNNSDFPIRVTQIQQAKVFCGITQCPAQNSNKNEDGTYPAPPASGTCSQDIAVTPPTVFVKWPAIAPHSTLQVNGTDGNGLGNGMIHMLNTTPQGCQGALFSVGLNITAVETASQGGFGQSNFNP